MNENIVEYEELKNSIINDIDNNHIFFIPLPEKSLLGLTPYNCNLFIKIDYIYFLNKDSPQIKQSTTKFKFNCFNYKT